MKMFTMRLYDAMSILQRRYRERKRLATESTVAIAMSTAEQSDGIYDRKMGTQRDQVSNQVEEIGIKDVAREGNDTSVHAGVHGRCDGDDDTAHTSTEQITATLQDPFTVAAALVRTRTLR